MMSTGFENAEEHRGRPFLDVLGEAVPGWVLVVPAGDGPGRAELRLVVAAARRRGVRVRSGPIAARGPDLGEVVRCLRAALRAVEELGLAHEEERVGGRLRAAGVEPIAPPHPRLLWSDFSETECRIAVLVSQGCTNHQIAARVSLSTHTVNYHLRKMFRKAGVNSRSALTRLLSEAGPPPVGRAGAAALRDAS
jgi:DNA-binding CsgD family transcriptional regulator